MEEAATELYPEPDKSNQHTISLLKNRE